MQIVGHEFLEITKGLYLSEDKKGVVVDIYSFTETEQKTPIEQIATSLFDNLKSNSQNLGGEVECVILRMEYSKQKDPWYWPRVEIDITSFLEIFPKMNKISLPDEFVNANKEIKEIEKNLLELFSNNK